MESFAVKYLEGYKDDIKLIHKLRKEIILSENTSVIVNSTIGDVLVDELKELEVAEVKNYLGTETKVYMFTRVGTEIIVEDLYSNGKIKEIAIGKVVLLKDGSMGEVLNYLKSIITTNLLIFDDEWITELEVIEYKTELAFSEEEELFDYKKIKDEYHCDNEDDEITLDTIIEISKDIYNEKDIYTLIDKLIVLYDLGVQDGAKMIVEQLRDGLNQTLKDFEGEA